MRNYIPDEKELLLLKEMAAEGCTISKIAAYTNHDRGTIRRLLERNKITLSPSTKNKMGKKYIWSQKKIERLRDFYSTNEFSLEEIANFFETSVNTILKQAKEEIMSFLKGTNEQIAKISSYLLAYESVDKETLAKILNENY